MQVMCCIYLTPVSRLSNCLTPVSQLFRTCFAPAPVSHLFRTASSTSLPVNTASSAPFLVNKASSAPLLSTDMVHDFELGGERHTPGMMGRLKSGNSVMSGYTYRRPPSQRGCIGRYEICKGQDQYTRCSSMTIVLPANAIACSNPFLKCKQMSMSS